LGGWEFGGCPNARCSPGSAPSAGGQAVAARGQFVALQPPAGQRMQRIHSQATPAEKVPERFGGFSCQDGLREAAAKEWYFERCGGEIDYGRSLAGSRTEKRYSIHCL